MRVTTLTLLFFLASLAISLAAEPEPNLARNGGYEEGASPWSLPKGFSVVEDMAHTGTKSLQLVNTDPSRYLLASQSIQFKPGMKYHYSAWVRTRRVQGEESGATICMEWGGAKGWLGGHYANGKKGDQDWFRVEGTTAPIPKEATMLSVRVYLRKHMTGTAWFDDVAVTESYPPALDAALLRPNYRGRLLENAADQRILVRARVADYFKDGLKPEQTTLLCSVKRDGKALQTKKLTPQAGSYNDATFDARELPVGNYLVSVELCTPDQSRLGRQEFPILKLPVGSPQPAVFVDAHNRTIVDGKPFFPLGWYFGPGPTSPDFQKHFDRLAASPFNTVMCYGINVGGIEKVRAYLDQLAARKLKIIYSIKDVYTGTAGYYEPLLGFRGEENIIRSVVATFKDHPALLGWYLNDELSLSLRDRLDARQRLVRELDPGHPTWAVLYQVDEFYGYLNSADVLGADPYPVPDRPVTMVGDWMRKCAAVSDGHRPLWMVPQAMDWACYRKDQAEKCRPPTLDEELVMTYLCLIHGARGLVYYSYFDLMKDRQGLEKRWADMRIVGNEVKHLFPALLSAAKPAALDVKVDGAGVESAVFGDDVGGRYVLLANPDPKAAAVVRVGVPTQSHLHLLRRGKLEPIQSAGSGPCEIRMDPMSAATLVISGVR